VTLPRLVSLWLPVLVWAGVIFALSSVPGLSSGLSFDFFLRKVAHICAFAALAMLLWRATRDEAIGFFGAALYAASDELHQSFVHGRHGAVRDVAFDTLGALLGLLLLRRALEQAR
jgi:VanZ family protein